MKKAFPHVATSFVLLLSFFSINLQGQCTVPITQTGANTVVTNITVGQTWLATCNGYLQSIAVTTGDGTFPVTGVTLRIWKLNVLGTLLTQIYIQNNITLAGNGATTTISTPNTPITSSVPLLDLGVYYFALTASSGTITLKAYDGPLLGAGLGYTPGVVVTSTDDVGQNPLSLSLSGLTEDVTKDLTFEITGSNAILPTELTSFKAFKKGNQSALEWETATEFGNHYFAIERSRDGKTFKEIGRIDSKGSTFEKQDYTFTDSNPFKGNNYYRLKQVDFNDNTIYSKVEMVDLGEFANISLYPNPTKGSLTIETSTFGNNKIVIFDHMGRVVFTKNYDDYVIQVNMNNLPSGMYFAEFTIDNQLVRKKIIKE